MRTASGSHSFDELGMLGAACRNDGSDFDGDRVPHGIRGRIGWRYDGAAAHFYGGHGDGDDEPFDRLGRGVASLLSGDIGPAGECDFDEIDLDALDAFHPSSWEDCDDE